MEDEVTKLLIRLAKGLLKVIEEADTAVKHEVIRYD